MAPQCSHMASYYLQAISIRQQCVAVVCLVMVLLAVLAVVMILDRVDLGFSDDTPVKENLFLVL